MPCDYKNYAPDWKTVIVPAVLARAHYRCERCGVSNHTKRKGYHGKPIEVILTVAHLDQDTSNNDWSNLAALCQQCHNTLDAPHRAKHRITNRSKTLEQQGQLSLC
jgi:5-methylcytosine-specific restriction endonuclease McrA